MSFYFDKYIGSCFVSGQLDVASLAALAALGRVVEEKKKSSAAVALCVLGGQLTVLFINNR